MTDRRAGDEPASDHQCDSVSFHCGHGSSFSILDRDGDCESAARPSGLVGSSGCCGLGLGLPGPIKGGVACTSPGLAACPVGGVAAGRAGGVGAGGFPAADAGTVNAGCASAAAVTSVASTAASTGVGGELGRGPTSRTR